MAPDHVNEALAVATQPMTTSPSHREKLGKRMRTMTSQQADSTRALYKQGQRLMVEIGTGIKVELYLCF